MADSILGVIGGSGLYQIPELEIERQIGVMTPYGAPSAPIILGRIDHQRIAFLPRHGVAHTLTPSELPYQANIYALKEIGVTHLLTISAVGSLKEELPPLTVVLPDQIIDRTVARPATFFGDGAVAHVGLADPFCETFRHYLAGLTASTGNPAVSGGTYICIEGPQFSTRAESRLYRSWNAAVIGMTAMPEARLAREAEICYVTAAMVTDYDVWHDAGPVSVEMVIQNLNKNVDAARKLLRALCEAGLPDRSCACDSALRNAIITDPSMITADTRRRLGILVDPYLPAADDSSRAS